MIHISNLKIIFFMFFFLMIAACSTDEIEVCLPDLNSIPLGDLGALSESKVNFLRRDDKEIMRGRLHIILDRSEGMGGFSYASKNNYELSEFNKFIKSLPIFFTELGYSNSNIFFYGTKDGESPEIIASINGQKKQESFGDYGNYCVDRSSQVCDGRFVQNNTELSELLVSLNERNGYTPSSYEEGDTVIIISDLFQASDRDQTATALTNPLVDMLGKSKTVGMFSFLSSFKGCVYDLPETSTYCTRSKSIKLPIHTLIVGNDREVEFILQSLKSYNSPNIVGESKSLLIKNKFPQTNKTIFLQVNQKQRGVYLVNDKNQNERFSNGVKVKSEYANLLENFVSSNRNEGFIYLTPDSSFDDLNNMYTIRFNFDSDLIIGESPDVRYHEYFGLDGSCESGSWESESVKNALNIITEEDRTQFFELTLDNPFGLPSGDKVFHVYELIIFYGLEKFEVPSWIDAWSFNSVSEREIIRSLNNETRNVLGTANLKIFLKSIYNELNNFLDENSSQNYFKIIVLSGDRYVETD